MSSTPVTIAPAKQLAPLAVDARTAARMLSLSERSLFTLIERGELKCRRLGTKRIFAVSELARWLNSDTSATGETTTPSDQPSSEPSNTSPSDAAE